MIAGGKPNHRACAALVHTVERFIELCRDRLSDLKRHDPLCSMPPANDVIAFGFKLGSFSNPQRRLLAHRYATPLVAPLPFSGVSNIARELTAVKPNAHRFSFPDPVTRGVGQPPAPTLLPARVP